MGSVFIQQFITIFIKNAKIHLRSYAFLKQLLNLAFGVGLVILLVKLQSSGLIPLVMSLSVMLLCRGVAFTWVEDRSEHHSKVQQAMGLSKMTYFAGWMVFYLLNCLCISLILIGSLTVAGALDDYSLSFGSFFALYFLYILNSFSFTLFLTNFVPDPYTSLQVITFPQLAGICFYFLMVLNTFNNSNISLQVIALLIPSAAFTYSAYTTKVDNSTNSTNYINFSFSQGLITTAVSAALYFLLFLYLSVVLPNQGGTNISPFFCFKCCSEPSSSLEENLELNEISSARYEEESSEKKKIILTLQGIKKSWKSKIVIKELKLTFFEGEIYSLLGHNGAGKSIIMGMLMGFLRPDSGLMTVRNPCFWPNGVVRRGVCMQKDVLYQELTVQEHLRFYASTKAVPQDQLEQEIEDILRSCRLKEESSKRVQHLSGGSKRKLCLACACLGNPQLLLLDEPTFGMDPVSRRHIWMFLQELKRQGKTIIFTTQDLEEAEAVVDRAGILVQGEMLIQGSSEYLKQTLGCGYSLEIRLAEEKSPFEQKIMVRKQIRDSNCKFKEVESSCEYVLKLTLPLNQEEHFPAIFSWLQQGQFEFHLGVNTLEDAFFKICVEAEGILTSSGLPELQKVRVPTVIPTHGFGSQVKHIFRIRLKILFRNYSLLYSILFNIFFTVIGLTIAQKTFAAAYYPVIYNLWSRFYFLAYFLCLGYAFFSAFHCSWIVREKELKFKYICEVTGMRKTAYWVATAFFDLLTFCLSFFVVFLLLVCYRSEESTNLLTNGGWFLLSLVMFALALLPFSYLWSLAFDTAKRAFLYYPFLGYVVFYVLPLSPIYNNVAQSNPNSAFLLHLLPFCGPYVAFTSCVLSQEVLGEGYYNFLVQVGPQFSAQVFTVPNIWYPLVALLAQSIFFFSLVVVIDNFKFRPEDSLKMSEAEMQGPLPEDLRQEKQRIALSDQQQPIVVDSLFKKYSDGCVAIKDNSFLVQQGQTFGLLGPNGSGKSTTFGIMTAAISKTTGSVKLHGVEVSRSENIFRTVGVCPQFSPFYPELTIRDHLQFFAGLRGLTPSDERKIISFYLNHLQLEELKNVRCQNLSSGAKRKLGLAIALIGSPSIVFVDELSTGVDPVSRKYLTNILKSYTSQGDKSIVLTTNSLSEAEQFCDRIGLLAHGVLRYIGSPDELKCRFGNSFRVIVKAVSRQKMGEALQMMKEHFRHQSVEVDESGRSASFLLSKDSFCFSKIFSFLQAQVTAKAISNFQVKKISLEEVFIGLSKKQEGMGVERL